MHGPLTEFDQPRGDRGAPPRSSTDTLRNVLVMSVAALLLLAFGGWLTSGTVKDATATYDKVSVTDTDEFESSSMTGSRKTKRIEKVRMVRVTLADGSTGQVQSDNLQVGSEAEVYRAENGKLTETEPEGPGFIEWAVAIGLLLFGLVLAVVGVALAKDYASGVKKRRAAPSA